MCFLRFLEEILRWPTGRRNLGRTIDLEPSFGNHPLDVRTQSPKFCDTSVQETDMATERQMGPGSPLIETLSSDFALHGPKSLENSVLGRFPPEIIIRIAEWLPTASAASFVFSCNAIKSILGTQYWEALNTYDGQLELPMFLTLLERDLPDYIFCYHCMVLHTGRLGRPAGVRESLPPQPRYKGGSCFVEDLIGGPFFYIYRGFRSGHFRMAMKQYRLGLDFKFYLGIFARETCHTSCFCQLQQQFRAKAKIRGGCFLLRLQQVVLLPLDRGLTRIQSAKIKVCPHFDRVGEDPNLSLPEDASCELAHQCNAKQCLRSSGLKQCDNCPLEYRIDLQECGELGTAVIITKWLDLGEGRTFLDPKWYSHFHDYRTDRTKFIDAPWIDREGLLDKLVSFEPGTIVASFEQDGDEAFGLPLPEQRVHQLAQLLN